MSLEAFLSTPSEKSKLIGELKTRASQVSEAIFQNNSFFYNKPKQPNVEKFADSVSKQYNLLGIAFYLSSDSILTSASSRSMIGNSKSYVLKSITTNTSRGNFFKSEGKRIYQYSGFKEFMQIVPKKVFWYFNATSGFTPIKGTLKV